MHIERIDSVRSLVSLSSGLEALLFASSEVVVDRASLAALDKFGEVSSTINVLRDRGLLPDDACLERIVLTPDFHKASSTPVGTVVKTRGCVLPQAPGNDIGCGMAIAILDIDGDEVASIDGQLDKSLRHAFFEGGRHIEMDAHSREMLMTSGIEGLSESPNAGLLGRNVFDASSWARRSHSGGYLGRADGLDVLSEWVRPGARSTPTRDSFLGTIGGGNHFVEIQAIDAIIDASKAWRWGLKIGKTAVMVHSGSLSLGQAVALRHVERAIGSWPSKTRHPENGVYPLVLDGGESAGEIYLADMRAAAHIAMANRAAMIMMVADVLSKIFKRHIAVRLIHDLPHNLVWSENTSALHRKGACPAVLDPGNATYPDGAPVIIPGSMTTASYLMAGSGSEESLSSAPHGAGRTMTRNAGRSRRRVNDDPRVIGPIDISRSRHDIAEIARAALAEESSNVYKDIETIVETVEHAGIATRVARLRPLVTVKG